MSRFSRIAIVFLALAGCAACSGSGERPGDAAVGPCSSDEECRPAGKVCDPLTSSCVDCLFDVHCSSNEHCKSGACVLYTNCKTAQDCAKTAGQPICSKQLGECVACEMDAHCSGDKDCIKNTCVAYTPCKSSKECTDQVCLASKGKCVDCLTNDDCEPSHECDLNECRRVIPCKSDKDCAAEKMVCDKAQGRCKACLQHVDCPEVYHCQEGDCVIDVCAPNQSKCASDDSVIYCNAVGTGFGSPTSCGPLKCVVTGASAMCTAKTCTPPCSGAADTCVHGTCKCGAYDACSGETDTCVSGSCKCGSGPPCSGATDTCLGGTCKCGTKPACSGKSDTCKYGVCLCGSAPCGKSADACVSGACKCGSAAACSGAGDTCVSGVCRCGTSPPCSGSVDTCASGVCKCGTGAACSGTADTCASGVCKCGFGVACVYPKICLNGQCVSCTTDAHCDDKLSCTTDSCVSNACQHTAVSGSCLIGGACKTSGDKDTTGCNSCDPTSDQYGWSPLTNICTIGGTCYAAGTSYPQGTCASCDPSKSATSWTVTGSSSCLIGGVCKTSGDKDTAGCNGCDPTSDMYGWTPLTNICTIGGTCYASGASAPQGSCAGCDPSTSTAAWTPSGTGCFIDELCHANAAKDPTGCGSCDPAKNAGWWTVAATKCLIDAACRAQGGAEPGGCGTCDPTKSQSSWTKGTGCLATATWSKLFSSGLSVASADVAIDASGNTYITGSFYSTFNIDGVKVTSNGYSDVFIVSFDAAGKHRWSKHLGGSDNDYGNSVAVDASGNVYVTGRFYGTADFGGGNVKSKGGHDIFLASYSSTGAYRWSKRLGGSGLSSSSDYSNGLAVDASGNVYVTGHFPGTADLGGGNLTSKGSYDIFLTTFTSAGVHRWSKAFGNTSSDYGYGVAVDASGNVYITGSCTYGTDFGGGAHNNPGSDSYLASFTPAGIYRWSKTFDGTVSVAHDVAVDASGNLNITGSFAGSVDFGGGSLTAQKKGTDIFLASHTSSGVHRWSKGFGAYNQDEIGYGVATDGSGNVYITGSFDFYVNFGGADLHDNGWEGLFVASFTASGAHRWSRAHGGAGRDIGRSVACHGKDVYVTGEFQDTVDFGGGPLTSTGTGSSFLLKLGQ